MPNSHYLQNLRSQNTSLSCHLTWRHLKPESTLQHVQLGWKGQAGPEGLWTFPASVESPDVQCCGTWSCLWASSSVLHALLCAKWAPGTFLGWQERCENKKYCKMQIWQLWKVFKYLQGMARVMCMLCYVMLCFPRKKWETWATVYELAVGLCVCVVLLNVEVTLQVGLAQYSLTNLLVLSDITLQYMPVFSDVQLFVIK